MSKCKIKDLITLQRGFDITKKEQEDGFYPVVSSSGINSFHSKFMVKGPGVVIGRKGSLGTAFYIESDFWPHDTTLWVKDFKGNNPYYIYCLLKWLHLENLDSGSANPTLNRNYVHEISIPSVDIEQQKSIEEIGSTIDHRIHNNSHIYSELESMAKTLYDYWFVQFDFPNKNGKPYRTSGGEMVWNEQLKREIPKGWNVTRLRDICDFRNGINYDKGVEGNQEYRIINVRNISSSSLLLNETELDKITLPSVQADKYLLSSDDIVIARSGTPGATRLMWKINDPTIFCGFIICSTPHEALHKIYLTYCLKSLEGTSATKTGGSILQNVSQDTLKSLFVLIPDGEVLRQFNAVISPILEKIHSNIEENNELTKLRDWLLPMLMNGQARVE